jgi:hypothetical protein
MLSKKLYRNIIYFLITSVSSQFVPGNGTLEIATALASFSIPSAYLLFVVSACWVAVCFSLINVLQVIVFEVAFKSHFGKEGVNYETIAFLENCENEGFIAPPMHDDFLEPSRTTFFVRITFFYLICFALLVPTVGAWWLVVKDSISLFMLDSATPLENPLMVASVALCIFPTLYTLSAFFPFSTTRQTGIIRWVFLAKISKAMGYKFHPRTNFWSDESKHNK